MSVITHEEVVGSPAASMTAGMTSVLPGSTVQPDAADALSVLVERMVSSHAVLNCDLARPSPSLPYP